MQPSKHAFSFGAGLAALLSSIRALAGDHCALLVPQTPIERSPRFLDHWPLSLAVGAVSWLWERQKQQAVAVCAASHDAAVDARDAPGAPPPSATVRYADAPAHMMTQDMFAADGMHPNELGYTVWGDLIAQRLLPMIRESDRAGSSGRG